MKLDSHVRTTVLTSVFMHHHRRLQRLRLEILSALNTYANVQRLLRATNTRVVAFQTHAHARHARRHITRRATIEQLLSACLKLLPDELEKTRIAMQTV